MKTLKPLSIRAAAPVVIGALFVVLSCNIDNSVDNFGGNTMMDIDENEYKIVKIGNQLWMAENLRTTRYNDGTPIPHVSDSGAWCSCSTPAYCYYNNSTNEISTNKFGALYNWYAVNTKKLAPSGWHVPTDAEWDTLQNYLIANGYNWDGSIIGNKIGKSMAAKTDWQKPKLMMYQTSLGLIGCDLTKNNKSDFSALPGGNRASDGNFYFMGSNSNWWICTEGDSTGSWNRCLVNRCQCLYRENWSKKTGLSIRLIRD